MAAKQSSDVDRALRIYDRLGEHAVYKAAKKAKVSPSTLYRAIARRKAFLKAAL